MNYFTMRFPRFLKAVIFTGLMASVHFLGAQSLEGGYAPNGSIDFDSLYIESYPELITTRVYLSQKATSLALTDNQESTDLDYQPNTSLNFGIGATVKSFTLNLAYGFRILNPDEGQGKTRYLDLQSHVYTRKLVIDFFGQFYKGMYLENTLTLNQNYRDPYYVRPDIYVQIFGLSGLYVFNNKKFSYRSSLIQNERQLKSSGSFLAGAEAYYGLVNADSALVPSFIDDSVFVEMKGYEKIGFLKAGPTIGYAYNLVIAKKFFAMASLTVNYGMGYNTAYHPDKGTRTDFQGDFGAFARFAFGYNDNNWYLGLSIVYNNITTSTDSRLLNADYGISNIRLNFVKRFKPGPKLLPWFNKVP
ncbi:DUF4421 domain-containing protein [Cryomorpha ignava]|uniref:DUF4421 domain-containing protein n=1 Tax=Cryomorpha ignava TaxID=101383 RepID=A0A7K3WRW9_9FLAO|nr:DUF4421 domain-containing protein [Cryomorpha ignava]NEN24417.1 DUF4421 domain-containing protein [Cryomorpha ignava]